MQLWTWAVKTLYLCIKFNSSIYQGLRACESYNENAMNSWISFVYESERDMYFMRSRRGLLSVPSICPTLLKKRAACVSSMVEEWGYDIIILL